jgi:hypothetical protein
MMDHQKYNCKLLRERAEWPHRDAREARRPRAVAGRRTGLEQVDGSLTRFGTDFIGLMQIHRFDPKTPVEETMKALHDVVKSGAVRYIGASSMWARQFAKMQSTAVQNGWTKFVSTQDQNNLLQREEEREMQGGRPHCRRARGGDGDHRPRLGDEEPGRRLADRRRHQGEAPHGCRCRARESLHAALT